MESYLNKVKYNFTLMSKKKIESAMQEKIQMEISRINLPRGIQSFGIIEQRLGGSRMRVRCLDGKTRICRIPGRLTRKLWVRDGDIVIVEPWEFGGDEKGDVVYKYTPTQLSFLRKKGHLKQLDEFEEF